MNSITYGVRAALVAGLGLFVAASVFVFTAPASAQEAIINDVPQEAVVEAAPVAEVADVLETEAAVLEETAAVEEVVPVTDEVTATAPAEEVVVNEAPTPAPEVLGESTTAEEVVETVAPVAAPELGTEEADYHPGETASIWGKFFGSLQTIVLKIFGSDENDQNYVEEVQTIETDAEGSFLATYQLDDLYRPFYEMVASTLDGTVLAEGWFRDSAVGTYDQCANDDGDGYAGGDAGCRYTNGNLNKNNSTYYEGDSTVQRVWLKGYVPGAQHTVTFQYGTTKAGKHAYDFLTSWNHSEDWITNADLCQGITGCETAAVNTGAIPQDPNAANHDSFPRNFEIRGGTITNVSVPMLVSGSYAGDSETAVTVSFTVANSGSMCSTKGNVTSCDIALFFGAHVSDSDDWAPELTAIDIPGSPYHVALAAEDGESIGQRDNQMQTDAIVLPSLGALTLQKTVVNDNGGTALDTAWTLSANGPTPISGVEGDPAVTAAPVFAGVYTLSESGGPAGYAAGNWSCTGGVLNGSQLTLLAGESATCVITNNDIAPQLTVIKHVVNNNGGTAVAGDFTMNVTATNPSDDSFPGAEAPGTTITLNAGAYSVDEAAFAGYQKSIGTNCSGTIAVGESKTCTITNDDIAPKLILKKTVVNDNGGEAVADDFQAKVDGNDVAWDAETAVSAGTHTASETTLPGYAAGEWNGACTADGSVTLALGETKTCTITNDDIAPVLHLRKVVVNDHGGSATVADFTLTADGAGSNDISGTSPVDSGSTLQAGTFALSESGPAGYTASDWTCVGGTQNGASVTLGAGQEATCTITNDDQPGALSVTKTVAGLAGVVNGASVDDTFTVTVTGPSYPSGHQIVFTLTDGVLANPNPVVLNNLIIGNYTVTEADAGTEWTETVPANAVAVVANQTASATVTNTYVPGSLELSKIVALNNYVFPNTVDTSFTFEVTGPSYPVALQVVINVVDGVPAGAQTLENLIPGDYTVSEVGENTALWTASGKGTVSVTAGAKATKAVTNSLKIPNTEITITPSVFETEPGQNVVLTITDTNNGEVAISNPSVELLANNVLTNPQPSYVSGDTNTNSILDVGETWTWTASALISVNTVFTANGKGTDPLGNPVQAPQYPGETESITVRVIGTTRTIGFWQTHTNFTSHVFGSVLGNNVVVGAAPHKGPVTTTAQLFGGFYAPIAKTTAGAKRTPIDQARIQMLQQLLAAKLNCAAFGCSAATQTLITNADAAYAAGNKALINQYAGQLDAFNNSGDAGAIPAGLPATGKATPKASQGLANLQFWNQP